MNKGADKFNDHRPTEELINVALSEEDEDAAWHIVALLHHRGTGEVLEAAMRLCRSDASKERRLGADILGQLGTPKRTFPNESFDRLAEMLAHEKDPFVLEAIFIAFSHLNNPRAIDLVVPWIEHEDDDVRFGTVLALSCHEDPKAIAALINLSNDADADVRDWATFGLGSQIDTDSPAIRTALFVRLTDPDNDTRAEAMVGLARRKDNRVIAPLIEKLSSGSVSELDVEAAKEVSHPDILPSLVKLKGWWPGDSNHHAELLEEAIASCQPKPS